MNKKHNILYLVINLLNGKSYAGVHSTDNLNDGYKGSGVALKSAYEKYGEENFKMIHLYDFKDKETAYEAERLLVDEDIVKDDTWYNLKPGGEGGGIKGRKVPSLIGKRHSEEHRKKISSSLKGISKSKEHRKNISKGRTGIALTDETKRKLSEINKGSKHPRSKPVLHLPTGIYFDCLKEAAETFGFRAGMIRNRIYRKTNKEFIYI